jgi:hypothetical protein
LRFKSIILIIIISIMLTIGCVGTGEVIYTNSDYPNITITNVSTYPIVVYYYPYETIKFNVTVVSDSPQRKIKFNNGTVVSEGDNVIIPVTATISGIANKTEMVSIAYNESKTITFDLGLIKDGNFNISVSTPTMNTTKSILVRNGYI